MRILSIVGALVVILGSAACVPPPQQGDPSTAGSSQASDDPSGCGAGCQHYLGCKGINDEQQWVACHDDCVAQNMDPALIAEFTQTDCATAIQMVEGGGMEGGEGQGEQQGGTGACTADCTGCVWDGSMCYHHAMSMMGSTQECESCCCAEGGSAQRWD